MGNFLSTPQTPKPGETVSSRSEKKSRTLASHLRHPYSPWLPQSEAAIRSWVKAIIQKVEQQRGATEMHPAVLGLRDLIEADSVVYMLFHQMFDQTPSGQPFDRNASGNYQIRDYKHLLEVFNYLLKQAPAWITGPVEQANFVGFPFNAVLYHPMLTRAGQSAFLRHDVNAHLYNILNEYAAFLISPASRACLTTAPGGWLSPPALHALASVTNAATDGTWSGRRLQPFEKLFECEPRKPAYGYNSWDAFFTRRFLPDVRPVAAPLDSRVIVAPCEAAPYSLSRGVKARNQFWIKSQPHSLRDMLGGDVEMTAYFEGGTVYQAYLSALSYHRWHAPVSGKVVKVEVVQGSYFATSPSTGFSHGDSDKGGGCEHQDPEPPDWSQGYVSHVATRLLMYIEAEAPRIGLVCCVFVGMAECSSCQATVFEGQRVKKGDEVGSFHYGGSTFCIAFRPGLGLRFAREPPFAGGEPNVPVCAPLAKVIRW